MLQLQCLKSSKYFGTFSLVFVEEAALLRRQRGSYTFFFVTALVTSFMIFPRYYALFSQQTVPDASFYESYLIALNSFDHESYADCEKLSHRVLRLKKFLLDFLWPAVD